MKYRIVCSGVDIETLESHVNDYIEDSWEPIGGVCVTSEDVGGYNNIKNYYQAMIKHEHKQNS